MSDDVVIIQQPPAATIIIAAEGVAPTGGGVVEVSAADATITVAGTPDHPTLKVTSGTFDAAGAAASAQSTAETFAMAAVATETTRAEAAEALKAPLASPALTGTPTAPTQTTGDTSTKIATDQFVATAVGVETTRAEAAEALLAPLASAALTGTPTAPTKTPLTNNTDIATTAYADAAVGVETSRATTAEALLAPKASPALTGTPTAPTATSGTNTTQVATTAYVQTAAGLLVPKSVVTAPGQILIASASGAVEALAAPTEIGQTPVMEGSDPSTVQWGYTRSLRDRYYEVNSALGESVPGWMVNASAAMGTTGLVSFYPVALPKGITLGHLNVRTGNVAASGPTHWWLVLADSSLNMLAVTADQTTAAIAASSDHPIAIATIAAGASSTFVTTYEGLHYLGFMVAVSTTMPNIAGFQMSTGGLGQLGTPKLLGVSSDTAATAPPSFPHTFGAIGNTLTTMAYASVAA